MIDFTEQFSKLKAQMAEMEAQAIKSAKDVSPEFESDVKNIINNINKGLNLQDPEIIKRAMDSATKIMKNANN